MLDGPLCTWQERWCRAKPRRTGRDQIATCTIFTLTSMLLIRGSPYYPRWWPLSHSGASSSRMHKTLSNTQVRQCWSTPPKLAFACFLAPRLARVSTMRMRTRPTARTGGSIILLLPSRNAKPPHGRPGQTALSSARRMAQPPPGRVQDHEQSCVTGFATFPASNQIFRNVGERHAPLPACAPRVQNGSGADAQNLAMADLRNCARASKQKQRTEARPATCHLQKCTSATTWLVQRHSRRHNQRCSLHRCRRLGRRPAQRRSGLSAELGVGLTGVTAIRRVVAA